MAEPREKEERIFCPYCDEEIRDADLPWCQTCRVSIFYCPRCQNPLSRDNEVCPHCGADIRGEVSRGA